MYNRGLIKFVGNQQNGFGALWNSTCIRSSIRLRVSWGIEFYSATLTAVSVIRTEEKGGETIYTDELLLCNFAFAATVMIDFIQANLIDSFSPWRLERNQRVPLSWTSQQVPSVYLRLCRAVLSEFCTFLKKIPKKEVTQI